MLCRTLAWTLLAGAGFAITAAPTPARQDKTDLPERPGGLLEDVNKYRREGMTDLAKAKRAFATFATYHAKVIASPAVYRSTQEFRPDPRVPSLEKIVDEFSGRIAVPEPGSRVGVESVQYIKELGAAVDTALAPVVRDEKAEPIVRINAARLLAAAARSGAPAHWPTVTQLIADPKIPPEVKFYVLKAAEGLLAAQDPAASITDNQTREAHYQSRKHAVPNEVLVPLVKAVDAAVTTPSVLVPGLPAGATVASLPPDQQAVVLYIRRQAIRALAQCRFPSVNDEVFPAYTLARITLGDPALVPRVYAKKDPPPEIAKKDEDVKAWAANEAAMQRASAGRRAVEAAEATLGLCNMWQGVGYNADAAADAVAAGLLAFADLRIGDPSDKTVAWRTYANRLEEAVRHWQLIASPGYDPRLGKRSNLRPAPEYVRRVVTAATGASGLLPEMDAAGPDGRATGNPRRDDLLTIRNDIRNSPNRSKTMFQDVPVPTPMDFAPAAPPAKGPPPKK